MNKVKKLVYNHIIPILGSLSKGKNKYINVIYYHDIVDSGAHGSQYMDIDTFKSQMEYLVEKGYKTYTFSELENENNLKFDKKSVLITFDDGWRSNYDKIFDYMKEKGIKYNIYLEVGNIGKDERYLNWEEVREMKRSGIVGFGAHTVNHISMEDPSIEGYDFEIEETNRVFERELGFIPVDFCYPYGFYSNESNEYLTKNTVYTRIYTSSLRHSYEMNAKIIFGRSSINADESFKVFKNKVKGNYNIFAALRGKRNE